MFPYSFKTANEFQENQRKDLNLISKVFAFS